MNLDGKVAVVTGGAVRLGRALSLALADAGCRVCVHYCHSETAAAETVELIRNTGRRAVAVGADFQQPQIAAETVFSTATRELGPVDVLVNSAAIFEPGTLGDTTDEQWDRHFAINLQAPFHLCREFARRRDPDRAGRIVNIVDWRATRPPAGHLAYTLSKGGLAMLTKILAQELAPHVLVNAIAPGAILPAIGFDERALDRLAERIPLQRTGQPADVAAAMLYLLRSEFVTGEIVHVTGGQQL